MKPSIVSPLKGVLEAVFTEFVESDCRPQPVEITDTVGELERIQISRVKCPNEWFTFALKEQIPRQGRFHKLSLIVFDCPVKSSDLAPRDTSCSVLTLEFFTDDPPYHPLHGYNEWEQGKGFWVNEYLAVNYLNSSKRVNITSENEDREFKFLLEVQSRVHELAKKVSSRGHWQSEWYPEGDFSKKHVLRHSS